MAKSITLFILGHLLLCKLNAAGLETVATLWNETNSVVVAQKDYEIRTNIYGITLSSDYWYSEKNSQIFWGSSFGFGFGSAHTSNKNKDIVFQQTYLTALWLTVIPTVRFKERKSNFEYGFGLPLIGRLVNYQITTTDTEYPDRIKFLYGLSGEMLWGLNQQYNFIQRLILPIPKDMGAVWMIGLNYQY